MDIRKIVESCIGRVHPRIISGLFKIIKPIPMVQKRIEKEYDGIMKELETLVKPYRHSSMTFSQIPEMGQNRGHILEEMKRLQSMEESKWKDGFVSGAVYHGDEDHIGFLNEVYAINSQSNPLHSDVWPSSAKYESEVVLMTANMLGASSVGNASKADNEICGVISSGGTESILLAIKTYRDWAKDRKGIIVIFADY